MLEYDRHFVLTANRALFEVSALRPQTGHVLVHHEPLENMIGNSTFEPMKKIDDVVFTEDGAKAFYFEAIGTGVCHVEHFNVGQIATFMAIKGKTNSDMAELLGMDLSLFNKKMSGAEGKKFSSIEVDTMCDILKISYNDLFTDCFAPITINSPGRYTAYRNFIKYDDNFIDGEVRLRFTGDYVYFIRNVAMYEHIMSGNVADIPAFEPFTEYDISAMADNFLALGKPPIVDDATHAYLNGSEYDMENGRIILLPYDRPGVYKVRYTKKPTPIADDGAPAENQANIDLDEDLCQLLPYLIAAFVWADDEDAKAQYYLQQYKAQEALILATQRNPEPVPYRNTYGW